MNIKPFYFYTLGKVADVNGQQGNNEKALNQFKKSFEGLKHHNSSRLLVIAAPYIDLLAEMGEYDTALKIVLNQSVSEDSNAINRKSELAYLKSSMPVLEKEGYYKKALSHSKRMTALNDSIQAETAEKNRNKLKTNLQKDYKSQKSDMLAKKNELLDDKKINHRLIYILLGLLLISKILLSIVYFKKLKKKLRFKEKNIASLRGTNKKLDSQVKQQSQSYRENHNVLEKRQRELVVNSIEFKNFRNQIRQSIEEVSDNKKASALKQKLKLILNQKDDWQYFLKKFAEVHPHFFETLKKHHPELTYTDLDFCAFTQLGLSYKEIASLMNIDHKSVISKAYRLRKKLGIKESDMSFQDWLAQYDFKDKKTA